MRLFLFNSLCQSKNKNCHYSLIRDSYSKFFTIFLICTICGIKICQWFFRTLLVFKKKIYHLLWTDTWGILFRTSNSGPSRSSKFQNAILSSNPSSRDFLQWVVQFSNPRRQPFSSCKLFRWLLQRNWGPLHRRRSPIWTSPQTAWNSLSPPSLTIMPMMLQILLLHRPVAVATVSLMTLSIRLISSFVKQFRTLANAFPVSFLHFIHIKHTKRIYL